LFLVKHYLPSLSFINLKFRFGDELILPPFTPTLYII
jgi:hypothetical protein